MLHLVNGRQIDVGVGICDVAHPATVTTDARKVLLHDFGSSPVVVELVEIRVNAASLVAIRSKSRLD